VSNVGLRHSGSSDCFGVCALIWINERAGCGAGYSLACPRPPSNQLAPTNTMKCSASTRPEGRRFDGLDHNRFNGVDVRFDWGIRLSRYAEHEGCRLARLVQFRGRYANPPASWHRDLLCGRRVQQVRDLQLSTTCPVKVIADLGANVARMAGGPATLQ
jgi:hypothetical protein